MFHRKGLTLVQRTGELNSRKKGWVKSYQLNKGRREWSSVRLASTWDET